eukprot:TRINITY_DN63724_c0_g1_i1.p2 TRINITY_DN63724_c0_g1~~TRINITY_DN63724_c0_g1_i1.p2  ORF type:complete len:158 (-),score=11.18 TRINITY_DN63724_c0_g1_i1:138-611(-)
MYGVAGAHRSRGQVVRKQERRRVGPMTSKHIGSFAYCTTACSAPLSARTASPPETKTASLAMPSIPEVPKMTLAAGASMEAIILCRAARTNQENCDPSTSDRAKRRSKPIRVFTMKLDRSTAFLENATLVTWNRRLDDQHISDNHRCARRRNEQLLP